jgi:nitrile hydratase beta subunit
MNGIHDMGGMHGMGPIKHDPNEPVFHEPWEGRAWGLQRAMGPYGRGRWGGTARYDLERTPPATYLRVSYYERWFLMLVNRLLRTELITAEELASGKADPTRPAPMRLPAPDRPASAPASRVESRQKPAYKIGQHVRVRNLNPEGHTRQPRYTRGKVGTVVRYNGAFALQDTDTNGIWLGGRVQEVYTVRFTARELWGANGSARDTIHVDLWEDYLERA